MAIVCRVSADFTDRWKFESSPELQSTAKEQWISSRTGPLLNLYDDAGVAFVKLPGLEDSQEFKGLAPETQEFIQKTSVPHYEMTGV